MTNEPVPFEEIYETVGEDLERVPWATLAPRSELVSWLDTRPDHRGRAVVVACGLGDDAEELARRGYEVTAFDVAPTAIEWCRRRFPGSPVDYRVASVFDLPVEWSHAFDLVVEVFTVQALPMAQRTEVITRIADLVAPSGLLFAYLIARDNDAPVVDRPWPVSRRELAQLESQGLRRLSLDAGARDPGTGYFRVVAVYERG